MHFMITGSLERKSALRASHGKSNSYAYRQFQICNLVHSYRNGTDENSNRIS